MKIGFRQGLVQLQTTPDFITLSGSGVDLNSSITNNIITIAYGGSDYLFIESSDIVGAWPGPFNPSGTTWLYWDIDTATGVRTFGSTDINPLMFGNTYPTSPEIDEHFFYTVENVMKVWDGRSWKSTLRVFAGSVVNDTNVIPFTTGTQINNTTSTHAGYILYDEHGVPLKEADSLNRGAFAHTESRLKSQDTPLNQYDQSTSEFSYVADTPIPRGYCVSFTATSDLTLSSYRKFEQPCIGISMTDLFEGEVGRYITDGVYTDDRWNFTDPPNTPVWVGVNGEITTIIPETVSIQRVGYVVSSDTIVIDIRPIIVLDSAYKECIVITASVTPTPTVTPTQTPTQTVTPTQTTTPTVTPTTTVTPTVTPTNTPPPTGTPTPTVTPTQTSSVTPTTTVTPTVTPTQTGTPLPTASSTPDVTPPVTPTNTPTVTPTQTVTPTTTVTPTITPTLSPAFVMTAPNQIPDNAMWLDGADYTTMRSVSGSQLFGLGAGPIADTDGVQFSHWSDKSGSDHHMNQGGGNHALKYRKNVLNGLSVASSEDAAVDDTLYATASILSQDTNVTIFSVFAADYNENSGVIFSNSSTSTNRLAHLLDSRSASKYIGSLASSGQTYTAGPSDYGTGFNTTVSIRNGMFMSCRLNGVYGDENVPVVGDGITNNDYTQILGQWFNVEYAIGDLAEMIVYDRTLNELEIEIVEDYLRTKWAHY